MYSNQFSVRHHLKHLFMQKYERYLPTAFDESMSILEKMNKLIEAQNALINVVNAHTEHTGETIERAFEIIDVNLEKELNGFLEELKEQKILYEQIRDKIHSDLLPDAVKQKLEEWLLNGTVEDMITDTIFPEIMERVILMENKYINSDVQFKVPSEYPDVLQAIKRASEYVTHSDVQIEVLIESGHKIATPVFLSNGDYSRIIISSEDDVVFIEDSINNSDLFNFTNCQAPTLNCLINAQGKCARGIVVAHASTMRIMSGCGVTNSGADGLYVRYASNVSASFSNFTESGQTAEQVGGITAWGSSNISAHGADVSRSKHYGVRSAHGSSIEFDNGYADDVGRHAMRASQQALLTCRNTSAKNSGVHGVYALDSSIINANYADLSGAKNRAVYANNASTIDAFGVIMSGSNDGLVAHSSSVINAPSSVAEDVTNNVVECIRGSKVNARNININGSQKYGVDANENSEVNIQNSTVYGSTVGIRATQLSKVNASVSTIRNSRSNGVRSETGSFVNVAGSSVWNNGSSDIYILEGSTVNANRCRTTTNVGTDTQRPHIDDVSTNAFNSNSIHGIVYG